MLCTPQEDWCQVMVERFEEEFGVDTNSRLSSARPGSPAGGRRVTRVQRLVGRPGRWVRRGEHRRAAESYVSPDAEAIPNDKKDADGVWTSVYVGALGFCSNTAVLEEWAWTSPARRMI